MLASFSDRPADRARDGARLTLGRAATARSQTAMGQALIALVPRFPAAEPSTTPTNATRRLCMVSLAFALAACSSGPPVPDWQLNAQSSIERFQNAYLEGNALVEAAEFERAREQIKRTGKIELLARVELIRCATRVASLVFETCVGFETLRADAAPAERAYAQYLNGRVGAQDIGLLPSAHRAAAGAGSDLLAAAAVDGISDPLSKLVAAGVMLRSGHASPPLLSTAVDTASDQGWRRPLLAWLGTQAMRAEKAGEPHEAQRLRRRINLLQDTASHADQR